MRISDWSSDVCSSDLCRWFLTCSSHGKLCNASVRGTFMALTKRWAGRAWGTNIGNVFVTLEGEDAALSGILRMKREGVGMPVTEVKGSLDAPKLSLTGRPQPQ